MSIQLVLAPDLTVTPADFVAAWNSDTHRRSVAEADLLLPKSLESFDPSLMDSAIVLLQGFALGIATNALYDLIKDVLLSRGVTKRTRIEQIRYPDGTEQLIVTIEEEEMG